MTLPLKPTKLTKAEPTSMGVIGFAKNGGFIYNHMSALGGVDNVAYIQEAATLDTCGGHSDGSCTYHFHSFNTHDDCTADGKWN